MAVTRHTDLDVNGGNKLGSEPVDIIIKHQVIKGIAHGVNNVVVPVFLRNRYMKLLKAK
jgi:hypothetical protein